MRLIDSSRKFLSRRLQTRYGQVYILPTGQGGNFIVIIFVLFLISLSYGHSLAFSSTFIFVAVVMTSTIFTHFNLKDLELLRAWIPDLIEANKSFFVEARIHNPTGKKKYDLKLAKGKSYSSDSLQLQAGQSGDIKLSFEGLPRGRYRIKTLSLRTTFPFGIFYSWSYGQVEKEFVVHPRIEEGNDLRKFMMGETHEESEIMVKGDNDFEGHSKYNDGDSINRIDWKVYGRTRQLLKKEFVSPIEREVVVSDKMIGHLSFEEGLEFLAGVIHQADQMGWRFGIDWHGQILSPDRGKEHYVRCLTFLGGLEKEVVDL
ncbi:MAG: DUF58 domain-containing protein [Deltaproteobacteria bacterium]|nr:MAG: DUF58 domain-containing protein [Deltaproteobacteria bacterium]